MDKSNSNLIVCGKCDLFSVLFDILVVIDHPNTHKNGKGTKLMEYLGILPRSIAIVISNAMSVFFHNLTMARHGVSIGHYRSISGTLYQGLWLPLAGRGKRTQVQIWNRVRATPGGRGWATLGRGRRARRPRRTTLNLKSWTFKIMTWVKQRRTLFFYAFNWFCMLLIGFLCF